MSRIRFIKPELFDDPDIGALTLGARWFFLGLLTEADRSGRLIDDSRRLKVRLLSFDDMSVPALIDELVTGRFLVRYTVRGRKYLQIRTFAKHQRPHYKEAESVLPPPPTQGKPRASRGRARNISGKPRASPEKVGASPKVFGASPPDSGVWSLESGVPGAAGAFSPGRTIGKSTAFGGLRTDEPEEPTDGQSEQQARNAEAEANYARILPLAHELLDLLGVHAPELEVTEALKERCALAKLTYNSRVVQKAYAAARHVRMKARPS